MITAEIRRKLVAFAAVAVLVTAYGLVKLMHVDQWVHSRPVINVVFADPAGVYPRASVDLLGVPVGSVTEVTPGPGAASTVSVQLDAGMSVPADVRAEIVSKSAIGEQSIQLIPQSADGPMLKAGDTVGLDRTTSPPNLAAMIGNLDRLVGSLPPGALSETLREGAVALDGTTPALANLLDDSHTLSASALSNVADLTTLIRITRGVLDTQVAVAKPVTVSAKNLAGLLGQLRQLDPVFVQAMLNGVNAGQAVSSLLQDNQAVLPLLFNDLVTLTDLGDRHLAGLRKSLVVFPWALEYNSQALRYCDDVDPVTGNPDPATCHYDSHGLPIWSAHVADVYTMRTREPYAPCTHGYEGTKRYLANLQPADGNGPREDPHAAPNPSAVCAAPPTDPNTPNVRGYQNLPHTLGSANRTGWGQAVYNPQSGILVSLDGPALQLTSLGKPPPPGANLGWLLTQNLVKDGSR